MAHKQIKTFRFNSLTPNAIGIISEVNHTVSVLLPTGTSVTSIIPTITINGSSINPASGISQNFTNPVTYTVTASDGTTQNYIVTISFSSFIIGGVALPINSPLYRQEHPRLLFTSGDLSTLRSRLTDPVIAPVLTQARAMAASGTANSTLLGVLYYLTEEQAFIDAARLKLDPSQNGTYSSIAPGGDTNAFSIDLLMGASTSGQQLAIANKVVTMSTNNVLYLEYLLAIWGHGNDSFVDSQFQDHYIRDLINTTNYNNTWSQGRGGSSMSLGYNGEHFYSHEFENATAWSIATNQDWISQCDYAAHTPEFYIYQLRPWALPLEEEHIGVISVPTHWESLTPSKAEGENLVPLAAAKFQDGLGKWWVDNIISTINIGWSNASSGIGAVWGRLLYQDLDLPSVNPNTLPPARLFPENGYAVMRSDWTTDSTYALFRCGRYGEIDGYWGRNNADNLHFVITKRGALAPDTGPVHPSNEAVFALTPMSVTEYGRQTVAHNSILVGTNPIMSWDWNNTSNIGTVRNGGQSPMQFDNYYLDTSWWSLWNIPQSTDFMEGQITAYETSPLFDYAAGDATHSYSPKVVSSITRQFVYLRPDTFVVFDRVVNVSSGLPTRWLLHSLYEPIFDGIKIADSTWIPDAEQYIIGYLDTVGTLATWTDTNTFTVTLSEGHGLVSGTFDVRYYSDVVQTGMTGTVVGNTISLDGGYGSGFTASPGATIYIRQSNISRKCSISTWVDIDTCNVALGAGHGLLSGTYIFEWNGGKRIGMMGVISTNTLILDGGIGTSIPNTTGLYGIASVLTANPSPGGHFTYTSGHIFTISDNNASMTGRLFAKVLLPIEAERTLHTVGGAWHDFEVDGINYGPVASTYTNHPTSTTYGLHGWRIELSRNDTPTKVNFLAVLQTTTQSTTGMYDINYITSGTQVGANITTSGIVYNVLFNTTGSVGGNISIVQSGITILNRILATGVEDNYSKWSSNSNYTEWVSQPEYASFIDLQTTLTQATNYNLIGPSNGGINETSAPFILVLNGLGPVTITPNSSHSGLFVPTSITWDNTEYANKTFTYFPQDNPNTIHILSVTNNSGLANPNPINYYVSSATGYVFTGPTAGNYNMISNNFIIDILGGSYSGLISISTTDGGLCIPNPISWLDSSQSQSFTYTPTLSQLPGMSSVLNIVANPTLGTNPSGVSYKINLGTFQYGSLNDE